MILHMKYAAKRIGQMDDSEINLWAKSLLLKIHVITGWTIPENELLIILVDQFKKKLSESYHDMNPEEIEYAFRQYGTAVKDWGKAMNLSLMDQVLPQYLAERKRISHEIEERAKPVVPPRILSDDELLNIQRGDIEAYYQRLRRGWIPTMPIPHYFTLVLQGDKLLGENETVAQFFTMRLNSGSQAIYILETKENNNDQSE